MWTTAKLAYGELLPSDSEPELVGEVTPSYAKDQVVLFYRADKEWEEALDALNPRTLNLLFGTFNLRKKERKGRMGEEPQPETSETKEAKAMATDEELLLSSNDE